MSKPRVLLLDIETLPNICYAFDLYSYKKPDMIVKEKAIVSFAWKWLGEKTTQVIHSDKPYHDKRLVEDICKILAEADYVIAHFGDKFDLRFIRSRALFHSVTPPAPVPSIDTYKMAKKYFHLNANRLDYLGAYLKVGRKKTTSWKLWEDCANGDKKALKKMCEYNKQDVILLEKVFMAMLPYTETKLNHNLFNDIDKELCPHCGSVHIQKRGFIVTKLLKRQRYQCNKCGSWFSMRIKKDA